MAFFYRIRGCHSSQHPSFSWGDLICSFLSLFCFFLVSPWCCRRHFSKGTPLTWRTEQKLIRILYFRTCGTFISDEDIVKAEAHFEANKVTTSLAELQLKLS